MFLTDTMDAIYPPESWSPQAVLDRLSVILTEHQTRTAVSPRLRMINQIADSPSYLDNTQSERFR